MKIVLLDEAQDQFEAEDRWWREHRDAKELFVTEFEEALRQMGSAPGIGQRYRRSRGQLIQRVLMPKARCHVLLSRPEPQHRGNPFDLGCSAKTWAQPVPEAFSRITCVLDRAFQGTARSFLIHVTWPERR